MRCINEVLPSETLLTTFKKLGTKEVMKAIEVCKLWWKLVDENKALWRILVLLKEELEETKSIVDYFDEKSGSTLEEISLVVKGEGDQGSEQLAESILKSSRSLRICNTTLKGVGSQTFRTLRILSGSLLPKLPNLVDF